MFKEQFKTLKNELKVFEDLTVGYKIMKDPSTCILYQDPPDSFQSLRRWWYGENRMQTLSHLDKCFKKFFKFLDKILGHIRVVRINEELEKLIEDINSTINLIIEGLHSLKFTYPHCAEIHCKVGSIILTMLDFKDDVSRINFSRSNKKRSNSFESTFIKS